MSYPRVIAALVGVLAIVSCLGMRSLDFNNSIETWFPKEGTEKRNFTTFTSSFGDDLSLFIIHSRPDLLSEDSLRIIRELTGHLKELRYVEDVSSIAEVRLRRLTPFGALAVELLGDGPFPPALAERYLTTDPLFRDTLISPEGTAAGLEVLLQPVSKRDWAKVVTEVSTVLTRQEFAAQEFHLVGSLPLLAEMDRLSRKEAGRFTGIAVLAIFLLLAVVLASVALAIITLFVGVVAVSATLSLFALSNSSLNMVASMLPLIVLVLCIANSVHIIYRFRRGRRKHDRLKDAVLAATSSVFKPCFFTSATTAIALSSFAFAKIPPLQTFGVFAALGVMIAFALTFMVLPAMLVLLPERTTARSSAGEELGRGLAALADRAVLNSPRLIIASSIVVFLLSIVGLMKLEYNADQVSRFRPDNPIRVANMRLRDWFDGVYPFELVLESEEDGHFFGLEELRRIDTMAGQLATDPLVHTVITPASYYQSFGRSAVRNLDEVGESDGWPVRSDPDQISLFFAALGEKGHSVVSTDGRIVRVSVRTEWLENRQTVRVAEYINEVAAEFYSHEKTRWFVTGSAFLSSSLKDRMITAQFRSIIFSVFAILAMLWLLSRRFRLSVIGLVPNVLPVMATLGLMGYVGVKIDVATILIASISLGIAVDDTVHLLHEVNAKGLERGENDQISRLLREVGPPISLTTLILFAGFSILLASSFLPVAIFGFFICFNILLALAFDLLLLPALLANHRGTFLSESRS